MSKMQRRGILGGVLGLAAAPAVQATTVHPDAALLQLGKDLAEAWTSENAAWALAETENADDGPYAVRACAFSDISRDIVDRIPAVQALTVDGVEVKLQAIAWCRSGEAVTAEDLAPYGVPGPDTHLIVGVLNDIAALG